MIFTECISSIFEKNRNMLNKHSYIFKYFDTVNKSDLTSFVSYIWDNKINQYIY